MRKTEQAGSQTDRQTNKHTNASYGMESDMSLNRYKLRYCTETVHHFHLQVDESYTHGSPTPQPMLRERLPRRPRETPRGSGLWKVPYMRVFKTAPGKALTTSLAGVVARLRAPVLLRSRHCVPVTCAAASPCVTRPCL